MNYSKPKTKLVLHWASQHKTPQEFIHYLEQLPVSPNKKGPFFLQVGTILYNHSNSVLAISAWKNALVYFLKITDKSGESACYTNLGVAYDGLGDFSRAIEYYGNALGIAEVLSKVDYERDINFNLCHSYYDTNPELAYKYCRRSIELSEIIGEKLVEEQYIIGFHGQTSNVYQTMVSLCLKLKREVEAFENTERSKSRAFLEVLAATKIKPTVELTNKTRLLLDEEEEQLAALRSIQTRHLSQNGTPVALGEVDRILEGLNLTYDKIGQLDPEYVSARRAKPLSFAKVQDMLSSLKKDAVIIEYFATYEEIFIFVISSKDKELHVKTVPLSAEKLGQYIDDYRKEVANYPSFGKIGSAWLDLSNYLIKPIAEFLSRQDLIYFVPYGLLHYLPLHALELNGEPLIMNHPIIYSPSASLIKLLQSKGSGKLQSCASFGVVEKNDPLKKIVEETADEVAKLFCTNAFLGSSATKQNAFKESPNKDVVHFSCHGNFNNFDPLSSGVTLDKKEILTAKEIFDMRLNAEVVTLGACQTGVNERSRGDELVGLTRAFLYSGASSVVVSLWSVNASSTKELLIEFYKLIKSGADKATALQEAQKTIMKKYPHPYFWAPFIIVGKY